MKIVDIINLLMSVDDKLQDIDAKDIVELIALKDRADSITNKIIELQEENVGQDFVKLWANGLNETIGMIKNYRKQEV